MEIKFDKKAGRNVLIILIVIFTGYLLLKETDRVKLVFNYILNLFFPFLIGGAIAFILNVPMRFIERCIQFIKNEKVRRVTAICLTLLLIIELIGAIMLILVPQIKETVIRFSHQLPPFFDEVNDFLMDTIEKYPQLGEFLDIQEGEYGIDWMMTIEKLLQTFETSIATLVGSVVNLLSNVVSAVYNGVFSVIFAFYCLTRKETLARQARQLLYATLKENIADEVIRIGRRSNSVFSNFITGQCMEAVILGLMFVPVMAIFKLPYIPLICVIIAVTALVPMVGSFVGCVLGALFILVDSPYKAFLFVIIFLALQQIEGNLVYPKVVGESVGLPGIWVLVAVSVGGSTMGVAGMLLMVPAASVLYSLIREYAYNRLRQKNIAAEKLQCQPPELQEHFVFRRAKNARKRKSSEQQDQSQNDR